MILTALLDNSAVSFALWGASVNASEAAPLATARFAAHVTRTADEYAALLFAVLSKKAPDADVKTVMLASVVPAMTDELRRAVGLLFPDAVCLTVGAGLRTGLTIRTQAPAEVGADLVAMAAGGLMKCKPPFLVLSASAVTTLCAVCEEQDKPAFLGCAILPGVVTSVDALKKGTAQLTSVAPQPPVHAIGKSTAESIRSGVVLGHVAAIEGLIASFEREIGKGGLPLVLTGEECELVVPLLSRDALFDAELAHRGLLSLAQQNRDKSGNPPKRG